MNLLKVLAFFLVLAGFSPHSVAQHHHGEQHSQPVDSSENRKLIDEFGKLPHCDLTGRYDLFFAELSQNSGAQGYVIIYQGLDALPAEYVDPPAARMFANHTRFRGFDAARITIVKGGFRREGSTQLWLVPPSGDPPTPSDTIPAPEIPADKTFLFDRNYIFDGDVEDPDEEFLLPAVKAEREAEESRAEEEYKRESIANGEKPMNLKLRLYQKKLSSRPTIMKNYRQKKRTR